MSKKIKLSQGKFTFVDDEDFDFLSQWNWYCSETKKGSVYAVRKEYIYPKQKTIYMHRLIANCPKGMDIDHIDGNRLNNQKSNLRICSHNENMYNRKLYSNNKSGYKGVAQRSSGHYEARIRVNNRVICLGTYLTAELAAEVYDRAAIEYHGKFAKTNRSLGVHHHK